MIGCENPPRVRFGRARGFYRGEVAGLQPPSVQKQLELREVSRTSYPGDEGGLPHPGGGGWGLMGGNLGGASDPNRTLALQIWLVGCVGLVGWFLYVWIRGSESRLSRLHYYVSVRPFRCAPRWGFIYSQRG